MLKHFVRVLGYVRGQGAMIALSVCCALLIAVLYSLNIGAVVPFLKVLTADEGIHEWIYRIVVRERYGIAVEPVEDLHLLEATDVPLRVFSVEKDSAGSQAQVRPFDILVGIDGSAGNAREAILGELARTAAGRSIALSIEGADQQIRRVEIETPESPLWVGPVLSLAQRIPASAGADFKARAMQMLIAAVFAITVLRCLCRFLQEIVVARISQRTTMNLRRDTFDNAIRLPLNFYGAEGTSDTISRFVQDANRVNRGLVLLIGKAVREPLKVIGLLYFAILLNAKLTLIMLLAAPPAILCVVILSRKIRQVTRRELESWSAVLARLKESLSGIRIVKAFAQEQHEQKRFDKFADRLLRHQFKIAKWDSASGPLMEVLGTAIACSCMILAAAWLQDNDMTREEFIGLVVILATAAESARKLGDIPSRLSIADAAAQRIFEVVDAPAEMDAADSVELEPMRQSIVFDHLSFTYDKAGQPALQEVNLSVQAGQRIAVVGPNGSGKTTLLAMIPRFYCPQSGCIRFDGIDIAQATLESLRRQIGIVTQQTIMFNESIAMNIAYGNPAAADQAVEDAARQAFAHEFIMETEKGYETVIGEQGTRLSGGQLQRLAIARAILHDPAILILDEATSQIDADSESRIQKALAGFTQGRTSFIIAHRLSTIVAADLIVVMDQGRLIAQGKHEQLLTDCHVYKQLYEMQFVQS